MSAQIYEDPAILEKAINDYFAKTPIDEVLLTGMIDSLGITKVTFYNYQKNPLFANIIDRARLKIEMSYEKSLRKTGRSGDIFALKNFGWRDQLGIYTPEDESLKIVYLDKQDEKL